MTAGNASPLNNGAAALVLVSDRQLQQLKVRPEARMLAFAIAGVPPDIMGIGPVPAIQKVLRICGLEVGDIDLFEINEAFAAQAIYCQRQLGIDDDRLNIQGGGIAIGHPLGCTGARIATTLIHVAHRVELQRGGRRDKKTMLLVESTCIGGGMGAAAVFRVDLN